MSDVMRVIMRIGCVDLGIFGLRAHRLCTMFGTTSLTCVVQRIVVGKSQTALMS